MSLINLPAPILHEIFKYIEPNHLVLLRLLCKNFSKKILHKKCNMLKLVKYGSLSILKYINTMTDYSNPNYFQSICKWNAGPDKIKAFIYIQNCCNLTEKCIKTCLEMGDENGFIWLMENNCKIPSKLKVHPDYI